MQDSQIDIKKHEKSESTAAPSRLLLDEDHQVTDKLACAGCGAVVETSTPVTDGATYSCRSCNSSAETRPLHFRRRSITRANSEAFKARLEPFRKLPFKGHEPEWFELALKLSVDPVNVLELVEAVHGDTWIKSNAPKRYLQWLVKRKAEQNGTAIEDPFVFEGSTYVKGKGPQYYLLEAAKGC